MLDIYILEALGFVVAFIFGVLGSTNIRYIRTNKFCIVPCLVGFLVSLIVLAVTSFFIVNNNRCFYSKKPHCLKNDVHCLERLLDWKKDSVKYNYPVPIKFELDTARILDSLKHELEKY